MSTIDDLFGSPVTASSARAVDAWNKAQMGFLAHAAATPEHLARTLELEPGLAIAHASRGLFSLLLGRRELEAVAREAELSAKQVAAERAITKRETAYVAALAAWNTGHPFRASALLDAVLEEHPQDALAMKLVQAVLFMMGDAQGMRRSIERVRPRLDHSSPAHGYALGCHAFTLEETGDYASAERIGRRAVEVAPDDAWGLHAVAHVYDMTNDTSAGIEWLSGRTAAWAHCNNFRYHVWWHLALLHLDRGEIDQVFALYDRTIRADHTDDYRDISNGASLLSRLELEGFHVGDRWEELADISERRLSDGCLTFADLHYMLALIGGARETAVTSLLSRIATDASDPTNEAQQIMKMPGLDAAKGLQAFSAGDYGRAFRHLSGARTSMQSIGGSHAQRDVFERLTIEAALRGGYCDAAEHFLSARTSLRAGREDSFAARCGHQLARMRDNMNTSALIPAE